METLVTQGLDVATALLILQFIQCTVLCLVAGVICFLAIRN